MNDIGRTHKEARLLAGYNDFMTFFQQLNIALLYFSEPVLRHVRFDYIADFCSMLMHRTLLHFFNACFIVRQTTVELFIISCIMYVHRKINSLKMHKSFSSINRYSKYKSYLTIKQLNGLVIMNILYKKERAKCQK